MKANKFANRLSRSDQMFVIASMIGVVTWTFSPHAALAQANASDTKPFVFEINSSNKNSSSNATNSPSAGQVGPDLSGINLPKLEDIIAKTLNLEPDLQATGAAQLVDPRIEPMREYLESKRSPLAPYATQLLQNYHYRLILGISFAESNFCRHNIRANNCWGIGGGAPEAYRDYPEALFRANDLIQKYFEDGLVNPKLMRNRWVGWQNNNWIVAVQQVTKELEAKGL